MKRKVTKTGPNTLTVSLPSEWVRQCNLKAGDEVHVETQNKQLIVRLDKITAQRKTVKIPLENCDKYLLVRYLNEFYRQGIEEITIVFNQPTIPHFLHNKNIDVLHAIASLVPRYIGLEILSQSVNNVVLQSLISVEETKKLHIVRNRIYFLIKEYCEDFINALDRDFGQFQKKAGTYHDTIAKFTNYYLRLLHASDAEEPYKTRMFAVMMEIDNAIDRMRWAGAHISNTKKLSSTEAQYIMEILHLFVESFDMIIKEKYSQQEQLLFMQKHFNIRNKVLKINHTVVISELLALLNTVNSFVETYVSIHMKSFTL